MNRKNVVILYGGSEESEISAISADFLKYQLQKIEESLGAINTQLININNYQHLSNLVDFLANKFNQNQTYIIPCIHGHPGESGVIPLYLQERGFKYLGCDHHASTICFNKITTKLWCQKMDVPVTPFIIVSKSSYNTNPEELFKFFDTHNSDIFIKTPEQGSSIGCYNVTQKEDLESSLFKTFKYDSVSLIEKKIKAREIEISAFTYKDQLIISEPGEIITNGDFYDFDKKYSSTSPIKTVTNASLKQITKNRIKVYCERIFRQLGLKDLSRIDFFVDETDEIIFLNEVNTFPGMTPISMFPKMMEATGISFQDYLLDKLKLGDVNEKN